MPMKIPKKALNLGSVAEYFDKIREEKERLISLLMKLVPDSFPTQSRLHLEKTILPKLLADERYGNFFQVRSFGFHNIDHFDQQIKLLQKAWKGIINISFKTFEEKTSNIFLTLNPIS